MNEHSKGRHNRRYAVSTYIGIYDDQVNITNVLRGCRGRDRMVVEFTNTCSISAHQH